MKSLKKEANILIIFILVVALYIVFFAITSSNKVGQNYPDYTSFSTKENGLSVLYDTLLYLKYNVKAGYKKVSLNTNVNDIQIIAVPGDTYFDDEEVENILNYVKRGGRVLFLYEGGYCEFDSILIDFFSDTTLNFRFYEYGLGELVTKNVDDLINEVIIEDSKYGEVVVKLIDYWGNSESVVFNEYYHGFQQSKETLMKALPMKVKVIIYQLIIIACVIVWFLGKRFGKAVLYYEEVEREQNEHIKALAAMFKNAGMGEVIVQSFYNDFIEKASNYFKLNQKATSENILELWVKNQLPHLDVLKQVILYSEENYKLNTKKKQGKAQLLEAILNINKLAAEVRKVEY